MAKKRENYLKDPEALLSMKQKHLKSGYYDYMMMKIRLSGNGIAEVARFQKKNTVSTEMKERKKIAVV